VINLRPAILITVTGGHRSDWGLFVAWPDGRLVWSEDRVSGGPPYRAARVTPEAVERTIGSIAAAGTLLDQHHFAPDARHTHVIVIADDHRIIDVASGHQIAEQEPGLVATATGIEPLNGFSRAAVLAAQPAAYRNFRARWDAVIGAIWRLCPAAGEQATPPDLEHLPWGTEES
jgi:hypothetical protein